MIEKFVVRCQRVRHNSEKIAVFFDTDDAIPAALIYLPVKCGPYEVGKLYRFTVEELAS